MVILRNDTKKTILLFMASLLLFICTLYFFIDFSKSIENGIKRFFNSLQIQYNYSTYNKTLQEKKKLNISKKKEEQKKIDYTQIDRKGYFEFKVKRFEKNEF